MKHSHIFYSSATATIRQLAMVCHPLHITIRICPDTRGPSQNTDSTPLNMLIIGTSYHTTSQLDCNYYLVLSVGWDLTWVASMVSTICHIPIWAPTPLPTQTGHGSTPPVINTTLATLDTILMTLLTATGHTDIIQQESHPPRLQTQLLVLTREAAPREIHRK